MGDLDNQLRASIVAALTLLDFDDGSGASRSTAFLRHLGMSPLFHSKEEVAAFVARAGSVAARGCGIYFGAALASALRARPSCVEPLVRPAPASATFAAPSRSGASSEPPGSRRKNMRPREAEYRAIPKAGHRTSSCNRARNSHHLLQPAHSSRAVRKCRDCRHLSEQADRQLRNLQCGRAERPQRMQAEWGLPLALIIIRHRQQRRGLRPAQ